MAGEYQKKPGQMAGFAGLLEMRNCRSVEIPGVYLGTALVKVGVAPRDVNALEPAASPAVVAPQQLETLAGTAALLSDLARYDLPLDYYDGFFAALGKLTVADLQAAAQKHLRPDTATICVVGDEKHLATLAEIHDRPQIRDREGAVLAP